jgi:hypothetical protein
MNANLGASRMIFVKAMKNKNFLFNKCLILTMKWKIILKAQKVS